METLTGSRVTRIDYGPSDSPQVVRDHWVDLHKPPRILTKSWTGCTIFATHQESMPVGQRDELALNGTTTAASDRIAVDDPMIKAMLYGSPDGPVNQEDGPMKALACLRFL